MPVAAVVQPCVERRRLPAHALHAPHELGEQLERRCEQVAAEPVGLRAHRRDLQLVRHAARARAGRHQPVALEHGSPSGSAALGEQRRRRRPGSHASCECECGSDAPASWPSFTIAEHRAADVACAALPGLGDEVERVVGELAERARVLWAVDDDFLPLERGVEVRHDAHAPSRSGRRRAGASPAVCDPRARAERAARELVFVLGFGGGARPRRARRRYRDPAPGDGITTKIRHRASATASAGTPR